MFNRTIKKLKLFSSKVKIHSLLSLILVGLLAFGTPVDGAKQVYAADENYAHVVYGNTNKTYNMAATDSFKLVERKGKKGRQTVIADNNIYVYMDISKDFMYDLPIYTPVEVIVEYFDEGEGSFELDYDSHVPYSMEVWGAAEPVYLSNTKEWKRYTYHIEDARMLNSLNGGTDLRIGVWGQKMGWSSADVIFGSITVRRADFKELVSASAIKSSKIGNIFDDEEEMKFDIDYTNKANEKVALEAAAKAYNENGELVYEDSFKDELEALETKTVSITPENLNKYGIYTIEVEAAATRKFNPGKEYITKTKGKFSVINAVAPEDINPKFGTNQQVVALYRGEPDLTAKTMTQCGMKLVRDYCPWLRVELTKGTLKIPEAEWADWELMLSQGAEMLVMLGLTNPHYDNNNAPSSPEAIAAYARYCGFMAQELKGICKYFEVWNEWNGGAGFNPTNEPPEVYVKVLKAAYAEIKKANPEAIVIGIDTAGVPLDWIEEVFAAGGLEYMDAVSIHPYQWNFGVFNWSTLINNTEAVKELMREYGGVEKPIWYTEIGFSTSTDRFTDLEQASNMLMLYSVSRAYDLCEGLTQYCLFDRSDPDDTEHNWGLLEYWEDKDAPSAGKMSYVVTCAMQNLIGIHADVKDKKFIEDSYYALRFYNNKIKKDIMVLNAKDKFTSGTVSLDLGCSDIEIYDMYGNKLSDVHSDTGIFDFYVNNVPEYIIGSFTKFEHAPGNQPIITADKNEFIAVRDDKIAINFEKNTDKNLHISMESTDVIDVYENNGFEGDRAELVVHISPDAKDKVNFNVTVSDDAGVIYYSNVHTADIVDPVSATLEAEQAVIGSNTHWRVRVKLKNMCSQNILDGVVRVTAPEDETAFIAPREFTNLKPGEERTILLNLPERVVKRTFNFAVTVELANGIHCDFEQVLNFGNAVYAYEKPVIDGIVSNGEWPGSWIGADESKDVKLITDWRGADDLSFSGTCMWDEENFYLVASITDDIYSIDYSPKEPHYMYKGDNIQFGLSDVEYIDTARRTEFTEIGVAEVQGYGNAVYRYKALYDLPIKQIMEKSRAVVKRYDTYTVMECKVPWSEIFYEGYVPQAGKQMRFSILANDNDGNVRRGWIEYNSGIGVYKDVAEFGMLMLSK